MEPPGLGRTAELQATEAGSDYRVFNDLAIILLAYYSAFAEIGISEKGLRALNGTHWEKTWDGAFSAARAKI